MNKKIQSSCFYQPRKRERMWSLSQLLGGRQVLSPQKVVAKKLFPLNFIKGSVNCDFASRQQTRSKNVVKNATKINSQTQRMKNTLGWQKSQSLFKRTFTLNPPKSINNIRESIQNQFQIHLTDQLNHSHNDDNLTLQFTHKSQQLSPKKNNKKGSLNFKNSQILIKTSKTDHSSNLLLNKKYSYPSLPNKDKNQLLNKNKKSFLKKGTSLQKQIVVNLLKNKIIKQHESNTRKQYTSKEILGMIKLYKGFHKDHVKNPEQKSRLQKQIQYSGQKRFEKTREDIFSYNSKVVDSYKKPIEGWQIRPQMQIQEQVDKISKQ